MMLIPLTEVPEVGTIVYTNKIFCYEVLEVSSEDKRILALRDNDSRKIMHGEWRLDIFFTRVPDGNQEGFEAP